MSRTEAGPGTPQDVLRLLDGPVAAAAVGAAMELGLFWLLDARTLPGDEVARALGIPATRCRYWLELVRRAGLLELTADGYRPSPAARVAILETYSQSAWGLLAEEARERREALVNLPRQLLEAVPQGGGRDYVSSMSEDPERASRFTRMLLELHGPLAAHLAQVLDLHDVVRLLDLGGGSGVISMALARRWPALAITIVDIANVCAVGRGICAEHGLASRITYTSADLLRDELPSGFDAVLECDVGVYDVRLFERVRAALGPTGRFLIVDQLASEETVSPPHLEWAFERSLRDPEYAHQTVAGIAGLLERAGFRSVSHRQVPRGHGPTDDFGRGMALIEARC